MMLNRAAEEIARPWREMTPMRPRRRREPAAGLALVAFFVAAAVLGVGLIAPIVWDVVTTKFLKAGPAYERSAPRPKAALKPFGAILADQIGDRPRDPSK